MAGSRHYADAPLGLLRHDPNELRARHCHDDAFVAVVLEGGYQEAGDEGRFDVRPDTLSRGFRAAYGFTPQPYRAVIRARAALAAVRSTRDGLTSIAHRLHFTDQAHMTHAIARLTGTTPGRWRQGQMLSLIHI